MIWLILSESELLADRQVKAIFQNEDYFELTPEMDESELNNFFQPSLFGHAQNLLVKHLELANSHYRKTLTDRLEGFDQKVVLISQNPKTVNDIQKWVESQSGEIITIDDPRFDSDRKNLINQEFKFHNKSISGPAINQLILNYPDHSDLMIALIAQICSENSARKIEVEQIEPFVSLLRSDNWFNLVDSIANRNFKEITDQLLAKRNTIAILPYLGLLRSKLDLLIKVNAIQNGEITLEDSGLNPKYYSWRLLPQLQNFGSELRLIKAVKFLQTIYESALVGSGDSNYLVEKTAFTL
jgi:DNA polymerase III delta subunit